jgi:hypothetical protein
MRVAIKKTDHATRVQHWKTSNIIIPTLRRRCPWLGLRCHYVPSKPRRTFCISLASKELSSHGIVATLELIRGAQCLIEVIRSSGEEMWRVDAYQILYYSRGIEGEKRTHSRFADWTMESSSNGSYRNTDEVCWRYGISRSCDECRIVVPYEISKVNFRVETKIIKNNEEKNPKLLFEHVHVYA